MEEKKGIKEWLAEKKTSIKDFCKSHPDVVWSLIGGAASILGGALKLYASRSDYDDYLYTTVDDQVYKLPAKGMKTSKSYRTKKEE